MSKTSRFTGKLGSRIGDRGSGMEDRLKKKLEIKYILNISWIVVMSLWIADCRHILQNITLFAVLSTKFK